MEKFDFLHDGSLYSCNNDSLAELQTKCLDKLWEFNQTRPTEMDKREAMLKEMFAEIGEGCYIEPPFHANWGGKIGCAAVATITPGANMVWSPT